MLGKTLAHYEITELLDVLLGNMLRDHPGARTWWESIQFGFPQILRERINPLLNLEGDKKTFTIGAAIVPSVQQIS